MGDAMTPENLKPKFGNVQMNPISPEKILRNLDHGYFMTRQEQAEAAAYIRQLQQAVLDEREACAVLVEGGNHVHPKAPDAVWAKTVARLIRARGEPSPSFKNYMGDNWAGIV